MVLKESPCRLGIFYMDTIDGMVDDYVIFLLAAMRKHVKKMLAVAQNGNTCIGHQRDLFDEIISADDIESIEKAYLCGLNSVGQNETLLYDEIVMFSDSLMGPVNSLDVMFGEMDQRDLDYWGIVENCNADSQFVAVNKLEVPFQHVDPAFVCIRKSVLEKAEMDQLVGDVYIDVSDLKKLNSNPMLYLPKELIGNRNCPVFKKEVFMQKQGDVLANSLGNIASDFLKYLADSGKYEVDLIWNCLLRRCNQADILSCLNLRFVLSGSQCDEAAMKISGQRKIALAMYLYFEDLIETMCRYASSMPINADIYITTNSEEKKEKIEDIFQTRLRNKVVVRVMENRGRDVASILVALRDIVYEYDYICYVHDKKTAHLTPGTVGMGFADKCFENTLYSKEFVCNVLKLFEENPRLGMLSPPAPNHADFFGGLGDEWGPNFDQAKALALKLGLNVPMEVSKMPVAPYGSLFWVRPQALKRLYDYGWRYEDFPEEPIETDGTILHAIERVYPFVVQEEGYYPAIVMSDYYAGVECTNLDYYARTFNERVTALFGRNYHHELLNQLEELEDIYEKYHTIRGEKYELELKSLETMAQMENLEKELQTVKGEKYELELKALETMKYIDGLHDTMRNLEKRAGLCDRIKKGIKSIGRRK